MSRKAYYMVFHPLRIWKVNQSMESNKGKKTGENIL